MGIYNCNFSVNFGSSENKNRLTLVPPNKAEQGFALERVNDGAFIRRGELTAPGLAILFKIQAYPLRLDGHENRVSCKMETQLDRSSALGFYALMWNLST